MCHIIILCLGYKLNRLLYGETKMSIFIKQASMLTAISPLNRSFSCTSALAMKEWRVNKGLPVNRNAEGILTDGPDYTFLDGRPTPLLHKQKLRMEKQQNYASRIVQLSSELDFAKERYQNMQKAKFEEREQILSKRLKPKGEELK